MNKGFLSVAAVGLAAILGFTACAPKPSTPTVDTMATAVAQAASQLLTETAAAASPTPSPTASVTPSPTDLPTPQITNTPLYTMQLILNFAGCYFGPGPQYTLESNISKGKRVQLLGIGTEPGWYIIRNPYFHRPCWIQAANIKIYDGTDLTSLPVMTPGIPGMGQ